MDIVTIGNQAISILVPAICIMLVELLRRRLGLEKMKKVQAELETKQSLAILAVKFAAQAYRDLNGPQKYSQAAIWLTNQIQKLGMKVTPSELKGLIESALRMIKDEFGEEWAKVFKTEGR